MTNNQLTDKREAVRAAHAAWSDKTFGSVGPIGPLKHLSKEALEAAAEPGELSEWADMQFLLWDAQRRAGIADEQITQAMVEKLAVNESRDWPEPKDGEPRFHVKSGAELQEHRKAAEPELKPANLVNKFYERYPIASFKSDTERAAALGYFMAGAELQCFGEFIKYEELCGDE